MSAPTEATATELARRLEAWGRGHRWAGPDPYEGLNARRRVVDPLKASALGRRALIQSVKRSPVDLRRALGIDEAADAASAATAVSAYARNGFLEPRRARAGLLEALDLLQSLRLPVHGGSCWGYHFDFQSRATYYRRGDPNTIATAFAGMALLDAGEALGDQALLAQAGEVGRFCLQHVPQTSTGEGAYFGYLPADRSPIHNSNMLVAALLARLWTQDGASADLRSAAEAACRYTTSRQRDDGAWPYGELPNLAWVDNFHTGYVLDSLLCCADAGVMAEEADAAWRRGIDFYRRRMFRKDGAPRYSTAATHPIDIQCVSQGIKTFAIASRRDRSFARAASSVLGFALRQMLRGDGLVVFQRHRLWVDRTAHMRWGVTPMLLALAYLLNPGPISSRPA